jgi:hypothetical protein
MNAGDGGRRPVRITPLEVRRTSIVTWLWRCRSEIALAATPVCWYLVFGPLIGAAAAWFSYGGVVIAVVGAPVLRRVAVGWARCTYIRHRLYTVLVQTGITTRAGRIPLVFWIKPALDGARATVVLRAGLCAADLSAISAEIAAACGVAQVEVIARQGWPGLVTVEFYY